MKKDLLIINGKCLTMSDDDKEYSWMLIRDDNIQDMGWETIIKIHCSGG